MSAAWKRSSSATTEAPRLHAELALAALKSHRRALIAWVLGSLALAPVLGAGYADSIRRLPGGARELAALAAPLAESFRPLAGPPLRLDTFGGYMSWRLLVTLPLLLAIYALVQGARVVRGEEARGVIDLWLAAGWSRASIVRDRALAFAAVLAVLAVVFGAGLWAAATLASETIAVSVFLWTGLEIALCAGAFFALALFLSQLVRTVRQAAGLTAIAMILLFVTTNLSDSLGPLAGLRFASPFFYYRQSRPLIPGEHVDAGATLGLIMLFAVLTALAALAFARRDTGAALLDRAQRAVPTPHAPRFPPLAMWDLWTAALQEQRVGLLAWAVGIGAYTILNVSVAPAIAELSEKILPAFLARAGRASLVDQYLAAAVFPFSALLVAAFVVVQSAHWAGDVTAGRVEIALSTPVSRARLVFERLIALAAALAIVLTGLAAGIVVGALAAAITVHPAGLVRALAMMALFALALGAIASVLVAWVGGGVAPVLSVLLGASFLLLFLVPLFGWPEWMMHLSLLDVYGRPYTAAPEPWRLYTFAGLLVAGVGLALPLTQRQPLTR